MTPEALSFVPITAALIGIIGTIFGAFFGAWLVSRYTTGREQIARRRAFRAAIQSIQYELNSLRIPDEGPTAKDRPYFLYDWQTRTIPEVRNRCAAILEDIPSCQKDAFEALVMRFSTQGQRHDISQEYLRYSDKMAELKAILQEMIDLVGT